MKKLTVFVTLIVFAFLSTACSYATKTMVGSQTYHLRLAKADYKLGPETSGKACSGDLSVFDKNKAYGMKPGSISSFSAWNVFEIYLSVITFGIYYILVVDGRTPGEGAYSRTYSAAMYDALKKTEGDVLLDVKYNYVKEGWFSECYTVTGRSATVIGPAPGPYIY
ncbi:hypothetical protein AB3N61_05740 [Leptospira sp. WS58.C1]|uniref:hypothetical protein n=1 Tax=Leptospira cinconiae TaxID=3235173 RepID=UPI00349E9037